MECEFKINFQVVIAVMCIVVSTYAIGSAMLSLRRTKLDREKYEKVKLSYSIIRGNDGMQQTDPKPGNKENTNDD